MSKPRKALTRQQLEKKLDRAFSVYIRRRDANLDGWCMCVTCDAMKPWREMDCGHFIKRQHRSVRWDERNAAAQCQRCNHFMGGCQDEFALSIIARFGADEFHNLMLLKHQAVKFSKEQLLEKIRFFESKVD